MRLITPANVAALAPLIEQGFGLFFSSILSTQVEEIVREELSASPDLKVQAVGKDTSALAGLRRYLAYGSRVENTLETSILAVVSIILAEFERTGGFTISGLYLAVLILVLGNLIVLLIRAARRTLGAFRPRAAMFHYIGGLVLSASIIVLNILVYPR